MRLVGARARSARVTERRQPFRQLKAAACYIPSAHTTAIYVVLTKNYISLKCCLMFPNQILPMILAGCFTAFRVWDSRYARIIQPARKGILCISCGSSLLQYVCVLLLRFRCNLLQNLFLTIARQRKEAGLSYSRLMCCETNYKMLQIHSFDEHFPAASIDIDKGAIQ